jgi:hypothetical protein
MHRATGILTAAVVLTVAACGGSGDANDAADTTTTTEATTTTTDAPRTTTTVATTTTTVPPQAALIMCSNDTLQFFTIGLETGQELSRTPLHTNGFDTTQYTYFNGQQGGHALCDPDTEREVFNADYSQAVGIASYTDDSVVVVIYDLNTGSIQRMTDPGEVSDFGNGRPEAQAATFTPDGKGLYWKETFPGGPESCRSFRAEGGTGPIPREGIEKYQVGVGGSCHGAGNQYVVWEGNSPLTCYSQLGCDDVNGDAAPTNDHEDANVTGPGGELPSSERFGVDGPFTVVENGLTYFIATDDTGVYLYSWNQTTRSEPQQVTSLGLGEWTIIAYVPKN